MAPIFNNQIFDCFDMSSYKISIDPDGRYVRVYAWEKDGLYPFNDPTLIYNFPYYRYEDIKGWRKVFWPLARWANERSKKRIWEKVWENEFRLAELRHNVAMKHLERTYGEI